MLEETDVPTEEESEGPGDEHTDEETATVTLTGLDVVIISEPYQLDVELVEATAEPDMIEPVAFEADGSDPDIVESVAFEPDTAEPESTDDEASWE